MEAIAASLRGTVISLRLTWLIEPVGAPDDARPEGASSIEARPPHSVSRRERVSHNHGERRVS
jgi:hypothetical protein